MPGLTIAELASEVIDYGGMVALSVRVYAAGDTNRLPCHAGHAYLFRSQRSGGRTPRSGSVDKPVTGPFAQAPMRSHRPAVRVLRRLPPGRRIDRKTAPRVRLTKSQTWRKTSAISSLACETPLVSCDPTQSGSLVNG
jgi:hypothetical protein